MNQKIISSLYENYKNSPKKLKIVCDWDEVIQSHEPYALWKNLWGDKKWEDEWQKEHDIKRFIDFVFWGDTTFDEHNLGNKMGIEYSPYGSKLDMSQCGEFVKDKQPKIKNSPSFYQEAPFLTIAEDLLKLIREDKVEELTFLSAYDRRKFPKGDKRKEKIFEKTFGKFETYNAFPPTYSIILFPFESETQGKSKADWIKENASDFDLVIDDNPNICRSLVDCKECIQLPPSDNGVKFAPVECGKCFQGKTLAPYYPATENQHDKRVLLIKNEVSDLKKEDFN